MSLALVADLHGPLRAGRGVEAQGHLLPHQGGIDLVEHPVEADGAVLLHLALGLEQEQIIQIQPRLRKAHRLAATGPTAPGGWHR